MRRRLRGLLAAVVSISCLALQSAVVAEASDEAWQIKKSWWTKLNDRFRSWLDRSKSGFQEMSRRTGEGVEYVKKSTEREKELDQVVKTASQT